MAAAAAAAAADIAPVPRFVPLFSLSIHIPFLPLPPFAKCEMAVSDHAPTSFLPSSLPYMYVAPHTQTAPRTPPPPTKSFLVSTAGLPSSFPAPLFLNVKRGEEPECEGGRGEFNKHTETTKSHSARGETVLAILFPTDAGSRFGSIKQKGAEERK